MKKLTIGLIIGAVVILLGLAAWWGWNKLQSSADTTSPTNLGSTDVTLSMSVDYNYATNPNQEAVAKLSITNNTTQPMKYMKVAVPNSGPTFVVAYYRPTAIAGVKETRLPIVGLSGHSLDARSGLIDNNHGKIYPIDSKYIATVNNSKRFPVAGYVAKAVAGWNPVPLPAIPAKSTYTLTMYFLRGPLPTNPAITVTAGKSTVVAPNDPTVLEIAVKNNTTTAIAANSVKVTLPAYSPISTVATYKGWEYPVPLAGFDSMNLVKFVPFDNECTNGSPTPVDWVASGSNAVITIPCAIAPGKTNILSVKMVTKSSETGPTQGKLTIYAYSLVSPAVEVGKTQQFIAVVDGATNPQITWHIGSLPGSETTGTITPGGLYTATGVGTNFVTATAGSAADMFAGITVRNILPN